MTSKSIEMKISIIMPAYNSSSFISEAILSVINQTYGNFELIIINDGSTDGTLDVVSKFDDVRIKVINQKNQGSGHSRNVGLDNVTGDAIFFLDSDDYLPDDFVLESMISALESCAVDVVAGMRMYDRNGIKIKGYLYSELINQNPTGSYLNYSDTQYDYHYTNYLYKASLINGNGLRFPDYQRYQDPPFFVKVMLLAKQYFVIPSYTYCYRRSHKTISWDEEKVYDLLRGLQDNVHISNKFKLAKLHWTTCQRINREYSRIIRPYISLENISNVLDEINSAIDVDLIKTYKHNCPNQYRIYLKEGFANKNGKLIKWRRKCNLSKKKQYT